MNNIEMQYLSLLQKILNEGHKTTDRTGTGTYSLFGEQIKHDFSQGFPLLTTKKVFWRGVVEELLWMLRGETNVKSLQEEGIKIWDEWADENGELGPVYGKQWRKWEALRNEPSSADQLFQIDDRHMYEGEVKQIDQIANLIKRIKEKPDCRRLIVSAWNPADIDSMKLPPCHCFFQFKVYGDTLHSQLYQRSADMFLGVPFNIASYALLTYIIAYMTDLVPGTFTHTFGDSHIYTNHIDQVNEQLTRAPKEFPGISVSPNTTILDPADFKFEDFVLIGYNPHPPIKGAVSV